VINSIGAKFYIKIILKWEDTRIIYTKITNSNYGGPGLVCWADSELWWFERLVMLWSGYMIQFCEVYPSVLGALNSVHCCCFMMFNMAVTASGVVMYPIHSEWYFWTGGFTTCTQCCWWQRTKIPSYQPPRGTVLLDYGSKSRHIGWNWP